MCKMQTLFRNCKMNTLLCVLISKLNHYSNGKTCVTVQCRLNTAAKYPKLYAAVEPFLHVFPVSYMFEAGVSYVDAFLNQRNRLNSEERGDLQLTQLCPTSGTLSICGPIEVFCDPV